MLYKKLLIYDRNYQSSDQLLQIFPETNYLLRYCSDQQQPLLHVWQSSPAVILGLRDKRLANLTAGVNFLKQKNFATFIRNSGGLAVVSDTGVINLSIFLPNAKKISVEKAYLVMYELIQSIFSPLTIEHQEVPNSYCPGDFDLVVEGKKVAGLAQRRLNDAVVIMAYLSISGDQSSRGQLIKQFYMRANSNLDYNYPQVEPSTMANLTDFTTEKLTIAEVKRRLVAFAKQNSNQVEVMSYKQLENSPDFAQRMLQEQKLQQRLNQVILRS